MKESAVEIVDGSYLRGDGMIVIRGIPYLSLGLLNGMPVVVSGPRRSPPMTFPTEADIEFFKEAKRIQELWEPKIGDWVFHKEHGLGIIADEEPWKGGIPFHRATTPFLWTQRNYIAFKDSSIGLQYCLLSSLAFLPRQGQLQEMLEEKGCHWDIGTMEKRYIAFVWGSEHFIERVGPTPSIALGRALIAEPEGTSKEEEGR